MPVAQIEGDYMSVLMNTHKVEENLEENKVKCRRQMNEVITEFYFLLYMFPFFPNSLRWTCITCKGGGRKKL